MYHAVKSIHATDTLAKAMKEAGLILKHNPSASVKILLENRYYALNNTLVINHDNGPGPKGSLTIKAMTNAHPKIGSAVQLTNWKPVESCVIPSDIVLSETQRECLFVAEVPQEAGVVHVLFKNERLLPRSKSSPLEPRLTNIERLRSFNVAHEEDRRYLKTIPAPAQVLKTIRPGKDLEILFTAVPWQLSILPVQQFDLDNEYVITSEEGTVAAFHKIHEPSWLENQPEFIRNPGEWAYDSRERQLFYYPQESEDMNSISVPLLKELIRVEGDIDYQAPADHPVLNIHFENITFLHNKRDTKDHTTKSRGLQHDWEFFDRGNALLRFRGAENCSVKQCRFTAGGGVAIRGDLHCQHLTIEQNVIDYVGSMGILLCGYGPGIKDVNKNNTIRNNLIHHTGEIYHHGHAIFLWQSGNNLIEYNTIHHVPRKAIGIAGIRLPLLELRNVTWDDSSLLIRWDEIDMASEGQGKKLTELIAGFPEQSDTLRSKLWNLYLPFLHARNNRVEYNNISRALEKLGDGAVINVSGAGEGNLIYRNYIHHIATHHASGVLRTDDWQSGTTFQENVIYMANISGIVRKNMTHLINNYLINVSTRQMVRFASYPDEQSQSGALLIKNIFCDTESPFVIYKEGYTSPGMVHPENTVSDYNLIWNAADKADAVSVLDDLQKKSIDRSSLVSDPLFKNIDTEDFRLSDDSAAHCLGILSLDVRKTGILEDFPEWLKEYDDNPGVGDSRIYHRCREKSQKEYLFW